MIELKEEVLESILEKAIQKAKTDDSMQLISFTKKIDEINPIQFFEAAKYLSKNRTFWTSTSEDFYIVGVGNAYHLETNIDQFQDTEKQWQEVINKAIVHNSYQIPGTGLLALGGMSFDPKKPKTNLWKKYSHSSFAVPSFMLTKSENVHYLTINARVNKEDHPMQLASGLKQMENTLLTYTDDLPEGANIKAKTEIKPGEWKESIREATKEIEDENVEKIVLAREMRLKLTAEAEVGVLIDRLITSQPNSFVFAFEKDGDCFIGATPERLVKLENKQLLSTCLAGTAPRGKTTEEDTMYSHNLLHDEKNLQEHEFVVKMIKYAIERYCTNINIPSNPVIYPLKNLQHLYTPVTATLKSGYSIFDIIQHLHPTPALGGVPRDKSLAFIRDHELLDRGWYGAPIGWLDSNQNGEFAVAIRSGLIQGDEVSLFAGCGVVKDSEPEAEYEETNIKFLPMLSVLGDKS